MPDIKALPQSDIHRICSGQVILDLSIAVKELVENSIDANSKSIEIKLKNYGLDQIIVTDNGDGIHTANWSTVALKHWTSKISSFEDLENVTSLGFRGEALSSLCGISKSVSIATKTKDMDIGVSLSYNKKGELVDTTQIAKEIGILLDNNLIKTGTTVTITGIFEALPVRLQEFKKVFKKEFSKCIELIQSYALMSENGLRISFIHITPKGDRLLLLSTDGKGYRENIVNLFGIKQFHSMFDVCFEIEGGVKVSGMISKPIESSGRNSGDRQFYSINKRPCNLTKFGKVINECYKLFNATKYPVVVLNFEMATSSFDVNLTPDKRTILIVDVDILSERLRDAINEIFEPFRGSVFSYQQLTQKSNEDHHCSHITFFTQSEKSTLTIETPTSKKEMSNLTQIIPDIVATDTIKRVKYSYAGIKKVNEILRMKPINVNAALELWESPKLTMNFDLFKKGNKKVDIDPFVTEISEFKTDIDTDEFVIEQEFNKYIKKEDFLEMKIIGQFNLGFIITKLRNDLFIIDQHASDEKFNYEKFRDSYKIETQTLIKPIPLHLSTHTELLAFENLEIWKRNGFQVEPTTTSNPSSTTPHLQLVSVPICPRFTFGQADLEELINLVADSYQLQQCKTKISCSKLLKIFASKACRGSVMIGDKLDFVRMKKIVSNMAGMDQPYNCPHGRPTMRHLKCL